MRLKIPIGKRTFKKPIFTFIQIKQNSAKYILNETAKKFQHYHAALANEIGIRLVEIYIQSISNKCYTCMIYKITNALVCREGSTRTAKYPISYPVGWPCVHRQSIMRHFGSRVCIYVPCMWHWCMYMCIYRQTSEVIYTWIHKFVINSAICLVTLSKIIC